MIRIIWGGKMFTSYFLAFLLAHLASDFVFQNDSLVDMKEEPKTLILGLMIHIAIVFSMNLIVFRLFFGKWFLGIILAVCAAHFIIDLAKSKYSIRHRIDRAARVSRNTSKEEKRRVTEKVTINQKETFNASNRKTKTKTKTESEKITGNIMIKPSIDESNKDKEINCQGWIFLVDQIFHIVTIIIAVCYLYPPPAFNHYTQFYNSLVGGQVTIAKSLDIIKKEILLGIFFCLAISVTNVIIKVVLEGLKKDMGSTVKSGRYIGGIERLLTIFAITAGAWAAIAVIYGSKTAIRFTQVKENPEFAEYYILGTSLSALSGVLIGIAVKATFGL